MVPLVGGALPVLLVGADREQQAAVQAGGEPGPVLARFLADGVLASLETPETNNVDHTGH